MSEIVIGVLFGALIVLLLISLWRVWTFPRRFFFGAETQTKEHPTMVITLALILLVLALAAFVAAALGVASRVNLIAAGLALWVLSLIVAR